MQTLNATVNRLTTAVERVLGIALVAAISLNFVNVIGRYVAGFTLTGVDEVEIYVLVAITFMGTAVVFWKGGHLRMDVLLNACPPVVRKSVAVAETVVTLAVALLMAFQSLRYVQRIHALGAVSDIAHVPTFIPHSAVFVCFAAIVVMVILRTVRALYAGAADRP